MLWLIMASLLWAFSFGLISDRLAGLDPVAVAAARLLLAALAFSPLLVRARLSRREAFSALGLGAVQFGLMYVLYIGSFGWLPGWKVALFTVFTPFFVIWISDLSARRWNRRGLAGAALAVAAALWVQAAGAGAGSGDSPWSGWTTDGQWKGFLLLQGANLCFAIGQVRFRRLADRVSCGDAALLAWMYLGAAVFTLAVMGLRGGAPLVGWDRGAVLAVIYLGLAPTALGFWFWNRGAARTRPGPLAVANDLKIPLAVLTAWIVFGEQADYLRALAGLAAVVAALVLARPRRDEEEEPAR